MGGQDSQKRGEKSENCLEFISKFVL